MRNKLILINTILVSTLYIGAGINHFWHPVTYNVIIPPYFPFRQFLVKFTGIIEIILGVMFLFRKVRMVTAIFIIAMLVVFCTVHIYMIQKHGCVTPAVCIPEWLAWFRLFPLQLLLIWWTWESYKWPLRASLNT